MRSSKNITLIPGLLLLILAVGLFIYGKWGNEEKIVTSAEKQISRQFVKSIAEINEKSPQWLRVTP